MVGPFKIKSRYHRQFEEYARPHLEALYRQAYRFCGQRVDAEDLVQELLTRLHAKKTDLASLENPRTWLLRALYNLFIDRVRQEKRHLSLIDTHSGGGLEADQFESPEPGPENLTAQRSRQRQLQQALEVLNPEQRALIALHDIEGHTLQELETITGTPIGTLKSRLHRARMTLRTLLREPFANKQRVHL